MCSPALVPHTDARRPCHCCSSWKRLLPCAISRLYCVMHISLLLYHIDVKRTPGTHMLCERWRGVPCPWLNPVLVLQTGGPAADSACPSDLASYLGETPVGRTHSSKSQACATLYLHATPQNDKVQNNIPMFGGLPCRCVLCLRDDLGHTRLLWDFGAVW